MVNIAAPKQMNMLVRRPAGRRFSSRSRPMIPPRTAANSRRTRVFENRSWSEKVGKNSKIMGKRSPIVAPLLVHRAIDHGSGPAGSANCGNRLESMGGPADRQPNAIALDGNHIIGRPLRLRKRDLPERGVAFPQDATELDSGGLHCSGVRA